MAHKKGVKVLVDGAHAFAHFTFNISELGCDYYGTSLHKWLSVPLGAGFLYVKKENIPGLWPLFGPATDIKETDIYRLNHTGTHPCGTDLAISNAIDYYLKIGPARKEARLRYLQQYWTDKVRTNPNIILNTPRSDQRSCGIANVAVKDLEPDALMEKLFKDYKIYVAPINRTGVKGCRVTPNIYTTPRDLDQLVRALHELAG
jgi:selenocysteine lyase/cysteine desulfurase